PNLSQPKSSRAGVTTSASPRSTLRAMLVFTAPCSSTPVLGTIGLIGRSGPYEKSNQQTSIFLLMLRRSPLEPGLSTPVLRLTFGRQNQGSLTLGRTPSS